MMELQWNGENIIYNTSQTQTRILKPIKLWLKSFNIENA